MGSEEVHVNIIAAKYINLNTNEIKNVNSYL